MSTGKGAYFQLDDGSEVPVHTDISSMITTITPANEAEEVDGTVLTSQKREFEPTYERDRMTLVLKWSPAATTFATGVKGKLGLNYTYGPNGNQTGKPRISGTCNVLRSQTIPGSQPGTLTTIEIELNINTEEHGTFPVV